MGRKRKLVKADVSLGANQRTGKVIDTKYYKHSSLVDYLAQVIYAKNCPTTFYCIFQLVWVPMTTTQNIRACILGAKDTHPDILGGDHWNQ